MNGHPRWIETVLAVFFSILLLPPFRYSTELARSQEPAAQDLSPNAPVECLRGSGEQLEFRLHGRLLSEEGNLLVNPTVTIRGDSFTTDYSATVSGDRYEIWLPVKAFTWFRLSLTARSEDGRRGGIAITNTQLRKAIQEGADIELQRPSKSITIRIQHRNKPVSNAKLRVLSTGFPRETALQSNSDGEAIIELNAVDTLSTITAWTDSRLLGGYQFWQGPARDPKGLEHVVELMECEPKTIHVVDPDGRPAQGVRLKLNVATPPPHYNYFGTPDHRDCEVVTDATGTAVYLWFPVQENVHYYAEVLNTKDWTLESQQNTDDAVEVVAKRPAPADRVRVEGHVSRGGQEAGGLVIEAFSFQGESENRSDIRYAVADSDGKFSFDALPSSTYTLFITDEQWVSEPRVFLPINPDSGEKVSPFLMALDGHPVTIRLTSGPDRKPIAGQNVSLRSNFEFSWKENGEKRVGEIGRAINVTTDEHGLATARVPIGSLKASVYSSSWRSETEIVVTLDKDNHIDFHRQQDTETVVTGRILQPLLGEQNLGKISLSIQSLDGESGDEFTPAVDLTGMFRFSSKTTAVGCFAYSDDGLFATAKFADDLTQPLHLELFPAAYLSGQLVDSEGRPVVDHLVSAKPILSSPATESRTFGFTRFMSGRIVESKTDANGNYRLGPLPRLTEIRLWCKPLELEKDDEKWDLSKIYIELDEERPPQVHRIGLASNKPTKLSLAQKMESLLRDARLGGYHAMLILADNSDQPCVDFTSKSLLDYDTNLNVASYMQMRFDIGTSGKEQVKDFVAEQKWPIPPEGCVTAIALDANGNALGQATFEVASADAKKQAIDFLESHLPVVVDAHSKWEEAFALARRTNRNVWVRISQRYCGPCHLLNRWLEDQHEVLSKEFVMLKIDDVRDKNGLEIAQEIINGKPYSIPFSAFYSADEQRIIDSISPLGNIGFMSGFEGKRHFRKMLQVVRKTLTDEEIEHLVSSLDN